MAVTDLTGYTWVGKTDISGLSYTTYSINFTSNNRHFNMIEYDAYADDADSVRIYEINNPSIFVYNNNGHLIEPSLNEWLFTGGADVTNATLITWLEANGTLQQPEPTVVRKSVDLTTLAGWASLSSGTHNITIVAKANGFKDSAPSAAVSVEKAAAMPIKGDIITLDSKQYRVLKTEGTVAEVLCMYDASTSVKFDSASSDYNNTYAGKDIDTYCNNTFYSGLSAAMKNAIVDKTFTQDSWSRWMDSEPTESHYTGKNQSDPYYLTLANAAFGASITRHCYLLSVQDVLDYLNATTSMDISDTTLTDTNIWQMFWNQSTSLGSSYPWLRSADASNSDKAFYVSGYKGNNCYLSIENVGFAQPARPAFQIDLSKIAWSK